MKKSIERSKNKIKELIKNKPVISETSKYEHQAGIYLFYIDDFSDDKTIPIYVGASSDLQSNYEKYQQILSGFADLEAADYIELLTQNFRLLDLPSIKMFQYLIDHGCCFDQLKMVILKMMPQDIDLLQEEQIRFIDQTKASYLGFNDLNTVSRCRQYQQEYKKRPSIRDFRKTILRDCQNLRVYIDYGTTRFNFLHTFPKIQTLDFLAYVNHLDLFSVYGPIEKLIEDLHPQEYKHLEQLMINSDDLMEEMNSYPETKEFEKQIDACQQKCNVVNEEMAELIQRLEKERILSLLPHDYSKILSDPSQIY